MYVFVYTVPCYISCVMIILKFKRVLYLKAYNKRTTGTVIQNIRVNIILSSGVELVQLRLQATVTIERPYLMKQVATTCDYNQLS